ncbi:MAG: hypothetical protein D6818_07990 [Bacteroidetes bacterium]|nr:MAG: hypothetical protein D6818_07990 [Bacteroidota bacterium]
MHVKHIRLSLWICLLCSTLHLSAQSGWEAGGWAGVAWYFGDLNTEFDLGMPHAAIGAMARYNFNKRVAVRLSANYATVSGDDARSDNLFQRARNLSFRSPIVDGTVQMEFNFLPFEHGSKDEFFTPYLLGGLTVFYFNPMAEYEGRWVELRPLGTEGQFKGEEYYAVTGALAYGMGFKISLNRELSLNFELSGRRTFTDYLDDVSTVYPDLDDLERLRGPVAAALSDRSILIPGVNDETIGVPGRQRGDSTDKDSYVFFGAGLTYFFGSLKCPYER